MMLFSRYLFFTGFVAVVFFCARRIEASCGLHVCPIPVPVAKAQAESAALFPPQIALESRYVSFDIGGRGSYLQTSLTGVYEHRLFRAGGVIPVVYLDGPRSSTTGLGNTTLFAEFYLVNSGGTRFSLGSQLETPTGNYQRGLGANHFMAVPYLNLWYTLAAWRFAVQAGYQQTLGSHSHGADAAVLYVNPHSDSELVTRAMASYTWFGFFSTEFNSSYRQVTAHDAVGDKSFVDLGGALRATWGGALAVRAGIDIPVISAQRYFYQVFVALFYYF